MLTATVAALAWLNGEDQCCLLTRLRRERRTEGRQEGSPARLRSDPQRRYARPETHHQSAARARVGNGQLRMLAASR